LLHYLILYRPFEVISAIFIIVGAHLEPSAQEFKGYRKYHIVYDKIDTIVIG